MRAVRWHGRTDVRVEDVPEPKIVNPRDAIVRVTSTAICGSDLHIYGSYIPTMKNGDILGHEFMGEVVEVGAGVGNLRPGDRVVVPFNISCGACWYCRQELWSLCDNSNPNAWMAEALLGYSPAGLFGYSHMMGGYAGGQAEYVRVPFADVGPLKIENGFTDVQVLFLTDVFPTGYMAAENCDIQPGDSVAVFGLGPVGQFAVKSAFLLGAEKVFAIDRVPERLALAAQSGAQAINYEDSDIVEELKHHTGGRGPDSCIDAVGMEAHGTQPAAIYDRVMQQIKVVSDRSSGLRQALQTCRKGGTVSIPGVYGGFVDKVNFGAVMNKALTLKSGQTHMQRYMRPLLRRIESSEIDPSFIVTHELPLEQAPHGYDIFQKKQDGCIKVVLHP